MAKRRKPSSAKSDELGEDIISKLPDALLLCILSLLPEADANRMRILSKRWKSLCIFLPNLRIVMPFYRSIEDITKFHNAVAQSLALRNGTPIQRFSLYCSKNFNYTRVREWLQTVVQCKVQELELSVPPYKYQVRFCWDLFKNCTTLVKLTLKGKIMIDFPEAELHLPCLKNINLSSIVYTGDQSFVNLLSGCPSLEELSVEIDIHKGNNWNCPPFNISSVSLKRLWILVKLGIRKSNKVVIDAPNLEYFYVKDDDYMNTAFSFVNQSSNIEAHITSCTPERIIANAPLSSAKKLTFTYPTMTALNLVQWPDMPLFPNLVELVVGVQMILHSNLLLGVILNRTPNLEHITFLDLSIQRILYMSWNLPLEAPACLRFKMKKIVIHNQEAVTREDFIVIRYLLEHSTNLETLTINAPKIHPEMREQLLSIHRGSIMSRIEFV